MEVDQLVGTSEYQRLVRIVAVTCGSMADAEDAVQDAFVASLDCAAAPTNLAAWVVTVAVRRTVGGWRRRQAEQRSWARLAERQGADPDSDQILDLRVALRSLSRRQLEAVTLYYFLGLSVEETANALEVSTGTVKKALSRARESLRQALEIQE